MTLRIKELQNIVDDAVKPVKADELRKEVVRVLGPSVDVAGSLNEVASRANDRIELLSRTGRARSLSFDRSLMKRLSVNNDPEVRRLAAAGMPQNMLESIALDPDHGVREIVSRRASMQVLEAIVKRYPGDDDIVSTLKSRRLVESGGLPKPKLSEKEFDYHGERLGDSVKQGKGPELSDVYYETLAHKLILDYGGNIEGQWEEAAVHRFVASTKATSGVEIDEERLYNAVKDKLEEKDDLALEAFSLKEVASNLRRAADEETYVEAHDPVEQLLFAECSASEFVEKANSIFNIKESVLPPGIKKFRVNEGNKNDVSVPCVGYLPHDNGFRSIDEKALDAYCKNWNTRQSMRGEPLRLGWSTHPDQSGKISFSVTLR
jgi:hypothetical protein